MDKLNYSKYYSTAIRHLASRNRKWVYDASEALLAGGNIGFRAVVVRLRDLDDASTTGFSHFIALVTAPIFCLMPFVFVYIDLLHQYAHLFKLAFWLYFVIISAAWIITHSAKLRFYKNMAPLVTKFSGFRSFGYLIEASKYADKQSKPIIENEICKRVTLFPSTDGDELSRAQYELLRNRMFKRGADDVEHSIEVCKCLTRDGDLESIDKLRKLVSITSNSDDDYSLNEAADHALATLLALQSKQTEAARLLRPSKKDEHLLRAASGLDSTPPEKLLRPFDE